MPDVNCSVANCTYWANGNKCNAKSILIDIDQHANVDVSTEFAGEHGSTEHKDYAENTQNTCCHTFKAKK
ncbi:MULTISPECIES: DUF1540 domain-containing protein [Paenibacillus]|uniref:DUF1540 domain-containing protein n=1 Tax=Paenibacillus TaxID=44249 RepID=UPI00096C8CCF|nr:MULTISPECIES: DUF1540 domain-containing protein [Paenibacillus]OMF18341.1 hypothetical protein BK127_11240 [Paenibacillus sp. FSL H7-0331]